MAKDRIDIVLFADTHLGFDYPIRAKTERRRRGPDFFENYRAVLKYAAQSKVDLVIHGGDMFFRKRVSKKIVNLAYEYLIDFADHGIPFYVVPGNHERSQLPVSLCLAHPNINVFDRAKTFALNLQGVTIAIAGFPFERHDVRQRFSAIVAETGWHDHTADVKLLCMHQAVAGAQVGPSDYTFRTGQDVVRREDFPADALAVLCGHIHRKQILTAIVNGDKREIPIIYPGSIERTSFAERAEAKGFYLLRLQNSADYGWHMAHIKFIQLPARPMADLYFDEKLNGTSLKAEIQGQITKLDPNAIVRLRCSPTLDIQVKKMLTSHLLREVLPKSMNFQFSTDFYGFRHK